MRAWGLVVLLGLVGWTVWGLADRPERLDDAYWGDVFRYVPEAYVDTAWVIGDYDRESDHTYTPRGIPGIYGGTSEQAASVEMAARGTLEGRKLLTARRVSANFLDLTTDARWEEVLLKASVEGSWRDKAVCQQVGKWAYQAGYAGLLVRSRLPGGGINIVFFKLD